MAKIFISYNAKDRTWAQWIGVTLRDNGHTPFVHEWEIGAGENIPHWMNAKLKLADRLLGVFTDAYTAAIYSGAERDAALWEDPKGSKGFLVPVEVETVTDWPPLVKPLKRLSLVGLNEADAEKALVAFLTPPAPPKERPPFPGRHTFADKRSDLDAVFEAADQANVFAQDSEPLPESRPALTDSRRPELGADEQELWANVTQAVEPLRPGGADRAAGDGADPQPIPSVASPIPIVQSLDGRIAAEAGALPELPPPLLEDLARTLAACRTQAERLRSAAKAPSFNGRLDYGESLDGYLEWLPTDAGTGNILLADSEARVLNKVFTADEAILATGFASRLSVFLENHNGLRAHYDELKRHYQAVRTGRIETPLERDAVEGIKRAVHDNTPTVFEESVAPVVDETAKPVPEPAPLAAEDLPPPDPSRPKPPRDPIADVDPTKSRSFIFAAAANRIWQIVLQGKDLPNAIEGWRKTYEQMKPHMGPILEWLRVFTGG